MGKDTRMDPSDYSAHSCIPRKRTLSSSSRFPYVEVLHSLSTALHDSDDESGMMALKRTGIMFRHRTDSGFADTTVPNIDGFRSEGTTSELSGSITVEALEKDESNATSFLEQTTENKPAASCFEGSESPGNFNYKEHSEAGKHAIITPRSCQSSRRSSFSPASTKVSLCGRPRVLSRTTSAYTAMNQDDPYIAHQRATHIFQSLEAGVQSPAQLFSSPQYSFHTSQPSLPFDVTCEDRSLNASRLQLQNTSSSVPTDYQTPAFTPATVIDWTDPSTRRRQYEKYDRNRRGIRGFLRKVAPRWIQGGGSRLSFYDGGSDAGSVRRYRMDLGDGSKAKERKVKSVRGADGAKMTSDANGGEEGG